MTVQESTGAQDGAPEENWLYVAPPEKVERAERARKELEAMGAQVWAYAKWWGFELHLNQEAVDLYLDIKDLIADILGEVLKEPLSTLVAVAAMVQKAWVQSVSGGYGCKLVSPWIAPLMLIPVRLGPQEDTSLWWTVFEPGKGFNEDTKFPGHFSAANPAAAEFKGRLYVVHRGHSTNQGDESLWWTSFDPDKSWTRDRQFPAHTSAAGPALAAYGDRLHCVHRGGGTDTNLWHTSTADGVNWSADVKLPGHTTAVGPALAAFDGKLHLVHRGAGSDSSLWHATFDGTRWSADRKFPAHTTAANPALVAYNGRLHCVHRGGGTDTSLYFSKYSSGANTWEPDFKLPAHYSLEGPGLAVFDNKVYCVHRGHGTGDQYLWWSEYNGSRWSTDQKLAHHTSGAGPAVIAYRDKNGTQNQLLVVHRGYGLRAAGTDAAEVEAQTAALEAEPSPQDTTG
ncbi:hypothetical protein ACIBCB_35775 [Streptomyces uncialis]|uniref:hypothetical protein n=1 Tax=Streptomyces uncialis TaxID=1048205 RepID=UPI0037B1C2D6